MPIEAKEILCSENPYGDRCMTMWCHYPKFVHGEHLRHRRFSFSVSSSRAIPVSKNLEEVRSDDLRAAPVWWGREQKGMQSGEELDDLERVIQNPYDTFGPQKTRKEGAQAVWKGAAEMAVQYATVLAEYGAHKSIVNRILEPFLHVNVLVTGTIAGWMNFFGLRLDKAAQPEIRALAEAQWRVWNESKPQKLKPGQWHLPFIDDETRRGVDDYTEGERMGAEAEGTGFFMSEGWLTEDQKLIRISVARCARLSYQSFETGKRSTIEEDLALYDRLVGSSPIHASPAEHQCTPDIYYSSGRGHPEHSSGWGHPEQSGNMGSGWIQYRKLLPGETVAPLPPEYL